MTPQRQDQSIALGRVSARQECRSAGLRIPRQLRLTRERPPLPAHSRAAEGYLAARLPAASVHPPVRLAQLQIPVFGSQTKPFATPAITGSPNATTASTTTLNPAGIWSSSRCLRRQAAHPRCPISSWPSNT